MLCQNVKYYQRPHKVPINRVNHGHKPCVLPCIASTSANELCMTYTNHLCFAIDH